MSNGHLVQGDHLCLLGELVPEVQEKDEGNVEVGAEEGFGVPLVMDKYREPSCKQKKTEAQKSQPSCKWLERCGPWQLTSTDSLAFARVVEAEIDQADGDPCN